MLQCGIIALCLHHVLPLKHALFLFMVLYWPRGQVLFGRLSQIRGLGKKGHSVFVVVLQGTPPNKKDNFHLNLETNVQ